MVRAPQAQPDPEEIEVRTWNDREGNAALESVRIRRPHELLYEGGFEIRLR